MPSFIASYDLNTGHSDFLAQAPNYGWSLWVTDDAGRSYRLPNTTLVGDFVSRPIAVEALANLRAATSRAIGRPVTMEKWIVAEYPWAQVDSNQTR